MTFLFQRGALEQETGRLKERWDQEGSEYKDGSAGPGSGTMLTVTAGKVFYCKNLIATNAGGGWPGAALKDGATTKAYLYGANETINITFPSPMRFETSAVQISSAAEWTFTVVGWEEDA